MMVFAMSSCLQLFSFSVCLLFLSQGVDPTQHLIPPVIPAGHKREDDSQGQLSRHKLLPDFTLFTLYFSVCSFFILCLSAATQSTQINVGHRPSISLFHMLQLCVFLHSIYAFSVITTVCFYSDLFWH